MEGEEKEKVHRGNFSRNSAVETQSNSRGTLLPLTPIQISVPRQLTASVHFTAGLEKLGSVDKVLQPPNQTLFLSLMHRNNGHKHFFSFQNCVEMHHL